ncbi:hypothetical protein [Mesorhizobium sp. CAU 1741]|uniref:hypothetical protein n=1 Tax=Mesorhizobium sp. CAU 1741 TaxID=3140366 RepID=UPI00325AA6EC
MASITLTDHQAVRDWAAARMGAPAIVDISPAGGTQPMLRLVFDQAAYQDQDRAERPQNAGGVELVEWDEWFAVFDEASLALVVNEDVPGVRENHYELVRRDDR